MVLSTETLSWLSGFSLILGGLLATAGWLLFAVFDPAHQRPGWLPLNALIIAGGVFMALGLPGFYARQATEIGLLGLIGFVLLFVGIVIPYIAVHSIETATAPNSPPRTIRWVQVGAPALLLGSVITGVTTWRADVYPAAAGILLLLSALFGLLTVVEKVPVLLRRNLAPTLFSMTIAWLGLLLTCLS